MGGGAWRAIACDRNESDTTEAMYHTHILNTTLNLFLSLYVSGFLFILVSLPHPTAESLLSQFCVGVGMGWWRHCSLGLLPLQ